MPDMLVPLYKLPPLSVVDDLPYAKEKKVRIVRAMAPNMTAIAQWVEEHFSKIWASECMVCFSRQPITCFVALDGDEIVGFACYQATYPTFFGPTGVLPQYRKQGIGHGLLLHALHGLKELGYPYGFIGGAGPVDFYKKTVNAVVIEDSTPGPYENLLP